MRLLCRNLKLLFKNHKGLLSLLLCCQIVSVVTVLLIYGLILKTIDTNKEADYATKMFYVSFSSTDETVASAKEKYQQLFDEWDGKLYSISLMAATDKENETNPGYVSAVCYPDKYDEKFSLEQNTKGEHVTIVSKYECDAQIGATVSMCGTSYDVIGKEDYVMGSYRVPYNSLPGEAALFTFIVSMNEKPTIKECEKMSARLLELFPTCDVEEPEVKDLMQRQYIAISYGICAIAIILAVFNTALLFRYIILKREKEIQIMRYVGGSLSQILRSYYAEILVLQVFSCCIGYGIVQLFVIEQMNLSRYYTFSTELGILFLFLIIVLFINHIFLRKRKDTCKA